MLRRRATEQHVDYMRQLTPPKPQRMVDIDPKLYRPVEETRRLFKHPEITQQPQEEVSLKPLHKIIRAPSFSGQLGRVDLEPFGCLEVEHGDIFAAEVDAVILPMTPNLCPYRGLALEAFDRGGRELVEETFHTAKEDFEKRQADLAMGDAAQAALQAGDTIIVPGRGVAAKNIVFLIMPWFWQGSPLDAAKRLRYCVKRALAVAGGPAAGFRSVALPNLGGGVFGYEPRSCSRIMLEEAIEALLQIEAESPTYNLKRIRLVDSRRETAEELNGALTEVSYRWLPERRLTTAAQFWGQASRRMIVLPAVPNFFWKRHRVKFKKYHGVKRRARRNYIGNVKPNLWRPQKVHQPPPLLVHEATGEIASADRQHAPRPFFFRGVSHWLFPSKRSGFHSLRTSSRGQWVGVNQNFKRAGLVRPRM